MSYQYHKKDGNERVIITLHGTGADEHDLDQVARFIDDQATLYGLRGDVNENGMLRWFKRNAPGVFDESDIHQRAKHLSSWLHKFSQEEGFDLENALFVGFSNGANMLVALMQLYPSTITHAAVLHGQIPLVDHDFHPFSTANVFVSAGRSDRMIMFSQTQQLVEKLQQAGTDVEFFIHEHGHQITSDELSALKKFWHELTVE